MSTVRNLVMVPAGLLGGILWQQSPTLPLEVAGAVAMAGAVVYVLFPGGGPADAEPGQSAGRRNSTA